MSATEERFARMRWRRAGPGPPVDSSPLPPGPRWPPMLQSIGLLGFRHRFVPWLKRRYGDVVAVRLVPGDRRVVLFHRPEALREIFAADPAGFRAGEANAILGPIMGEHSLLLADGEQHQRARRLLTPAFNGHALRGYADGVSELARTEVARWRPDVGHSVELRALEAMNALTLEVILRVVFGVTDEQRLARLRPLVNRTVNIEPYVVLGWSVPALQRFGPWRAVVDNQRALDEAIHAEIAERRAAPGLAARADVLSRLLQAGSAADGRLSDDELRDQLVTLLLAGHETTATALAWALYELGRDPAQLARARAAALSDDVGHLECVLKEAMRLHPVIPMVVRRLTEPATIGGVDLPAGVDVAASILLAHRDPRNFALPLVFRPERFADGPVPANTWLPFGGGVRRCLGAGFSMMEGVAVLREVLAAYDVSAPQPDEPRVRNITSVPRHGARIVLTSRSVG